MKLSSIVSFSSLLLPSAASFAPPPSAVVDVRISRISSPATARVAAGGAKKGANDNAKTGGRRTTMPLGESNSSALAITTENAHVTEEGDYPSPLSAPSSFADFDHLAHWYPANWACNLVLNASQKVMIFNVNKYLHMYLQDLRRCDRWRVPAQGCVSVRGSRHLLRNQKLPVRLPRLVVRRDWGRRVYVGGGAIVQLRQRRVGNDTPGDVVALPRIRSPHKDWVKF